MLILRMVGTMKGSEKKIKTRREGLPPGTYNADSFAKLFPDEYKQMRQAGYKGVEVGENVTFTVGAI